MVPFIIFAIRHKEKGHMKQFFTSDFWNKFIEKSAEHALPAVVEIVFILALFFIGRLILFRLINRTIALVIMREKAAGNGDSVARARTLGGLLRSVTGYVLIFIAGIMILRVMGADPLPLITTAGVLGLGIGFGAQKLVRDVITGFFILLENQYVVGECVTIGAVTGVIEEIGMRTTKVRDEEGRLTIISNGDITQVTNHSRGPQAPV